MEKTAFRKIGILCVFMIFIVACSSEKKENDLDEMAIKGKVKFLTEYSYKALEKFGEIEKGERKKINGTDYVDFKNEYNEKGNVVKSIKYNSDDSVLDSYTKKYDKNDNQIEYNYYNSSSEIESKRTYEYDENGNMIKLNEFSDGGLLIYIIYKYDENGNKIETIDSTARGWLYSKTIFKYDNNGNIIDSSHYNSEGSIRTRDTYKYDKNDNQVEHQHTYLTPNYHDHDQYKEVFKFDNNGNKTKFNFYNSKGELRLEQDYKYDEKNNLINHHTQSYYFNGSIVSSDYSYKYDENSNKIEYIQFNSDGSIFYKSNYKYVYDENDNWINKIFYKDNVAYFIIERTIEYYN